MMFVYYLIVNKSMIKTQIVSEGVFTDVGRGPLVRRRPCFPMILNWLAGGCWILLLSGT